MYQIILALHIISIISWMAGALYLFRLFVYHSAESEDVVKERFITMESKLFRIITVPAMVASVVFGFVLIFINPQLFLEAWLHLKLALVLALAFVTYQAGIYMAELKAGACKKSEKFFRFLNEVPTLLMIGIVFLVILKPF